MIQFDWGDADNKIIVMKFTRNWTVQEFNDNIDLVYKTIKDQDQDLMLVIDMQASYGPPANIIRSAARAFAAAPENLTDIVVVSKNSIWKKLWYLINRTFNLSHIPMRFVDDANLIFSSEEEELTEV